MLVQIGQTVKLVQNEYQIATNPTDNMSVFTSNDKSGYSLHMVIICIGLELATFTLAGVLIYVFALYLDQYNAERDNMVKATAALLMMYLLSKLF